MSRARGGAARQKKFCDSSAAAALGRVAICRRNRTFFAVLRLSFFGIDRFWGME